MSSTKAKNIERDWRNAGMKIGGDVSFVKVNGITYGVMFRYKADVQQLALQMKMKQIARNHDCFLFVDFAQPGQWEEGTVTFIHQLELLDWEQTLKAKVEAHQQSFGYVQEQDTSLRVMKYLLSAIAYLELSLNKAKENDIFLPNGLEFWSHYEEIARIQKRVLYAKEVDFRRETMYTALAELWWKK
jgi:hypothetical protein